MAKQWLKLLAGARGPALAPGSERGAGARRAPPHGRQARPGDERSEPVDRDDGGG
jgi:hypothetical protein